MKKIVTVFLLISMSVSLWAQSVEESTPAQDKQLDVLLYGIDSQVIEVLESLRANKIDSYNEVLVDVFEEIRSPEIRRKILELWNDTQWAEAMPVAEQVLLHVVEDEDFDISVVQEAVSYISEMGSKENFDILLQLASNSDSRIAAPAIRGTGKLAAASEAGTEDFDSIGRPLLDLLNEAVSEAEEDVTAALIVALGELQYKPAGEKLLAIAEDEGSSNGHRCFACVSLGKIGGEKYSKAVENLYFNSPDALLRSYALAGLAEFEQDSTGILVKALKRDSFWRIRLTAAEKLGGTPPDESVDSLLRYKASEDPVPHVRKAALESLGKRKGETNNSYLGQFYLDEKNPAELRLTALNVMVENHIPDITNAVNTVMDKLWEKDDRRFLEFTCRNLSLLNWGELEVLYERMLSHSNWLIQVYGVRGVRRNQIEALYESIDALDTEESNGLLLREIRREQK